MMIYPLKIVKCCLVMVLFLKGFVRGTCPRRMDESKVARMCYDSEAIGADVYIDTSAAKATENIAANVCQCSVQLYNAKQVKLRTTGIASVCGSVIEFKKSDQESLWSHKNCSLYHTATSLTWREDEMMISLHKQQQPYLTDFCVSLYLVYCDFKSQYQCSSGQCISKFAVCDNLGDCPDRDDEDGPCPGACSEGQYSCADDSGCYSYRKKCDNITDCSDGSDERGCGNSTDAGVSTTTPSPAFSEPMIKVNCFRSKMFSTTTTATTTTTTTPTTTTTTTTTPTTTTTTTTTTPTTTTTTTTPTTTTTTSTQQTSTTTTPSTTQSTTTSTPKPSSSPTKSTTTFIKLDSSKLSSYFPNVYHTTEQYNAKTGSPTDIDRGKSDLLKNPYVLAGIGIGAAVIVGTTALIIVLMRKRRKHSQTTPDLWIPEKGAEMEPLNQ